MCRKAIIGIMIILVVGFSQTQYKEGRDGTRRSPNLLNYQGYLTDTLGVPIDDTLSMSFKIFDDATAGIKIWSETQSNVPVVRGVFSALLGSVVPIPDTVFTQGTDRWLELEVETQILAPRTRIVSVAYAYTSTYSDTAEYARNAVADHDWVRGTPDSVLFTANYLGVARGGADNALYGSNVRNHVNFGTQCTTGVSAANYSYITVAGGIRNAAVHNYAAIGGGTGNRATGSVSTIAGGSTNEASGTYSACGGGRNNISSGDYTAVAGGYSNEVTDYYSIIGGGYNNSVTERYSVILGGSSNAVYGERAAIISGHSNSVTGNYGIAGGYNHTVNNVCGAVLSGYNNVTGVAVEDTAAFVGGGRQNNARSKYSTIAGGRIDTVYALYGAALAGYHNVAGSLITDTATVIVGGFGNRTTNKYTTITGGLENSASGTYATVGGGWLNEATGTYATVSGGFNNVAGVVSAVGGGSGNEIWGSGVIAGGSGNTIDSSSGAICGGLDNRVNDEYGFIGGGQENLVEGEYGTIGGGKWNDALANYAVIAGGLHNRAEGVYSFIGSGYYNYTGGQYAAVAGGEEDTSAGPYSFTTNRNSVVGSEWDYSAAFNGRAASAHSQLACYNFSSTGAKAFTIDHPLDPMGKILNHYCIESAEMMLMYRGTATIGDNERVSVQLPDYFDALSKDAKIHLTGIGTYEVFVAERVSGNQFVIGGKPGTEVDWLVTAERSDQSAEIAKIVMPVEQQKTGSLAGRSFDDGYLATTKEYLESIGKAAGFEFRTERGRQKYQRWTQD